MSHSSDDNWKQLHVIGKCDSQQTSHWNKCPNHKLKHKYLWMMIYSSSSGCGANLPSHQQCNLTDLPGDNPSDGKLHLWKPALSDLAAQSGAIMDRWQRLTVVTGLESITSSSVHTRQCKCKTRNRSKGAIASELCEQSVFSLYLRQDTHLLQSCASITALTYSLLILPVIYQLFQL